MIYKCNLVKIIAIFLGMTLSSALSARDCTSAWRKVDYRIVPFPDLGAQYLSYQFRIPAGKPITLQFSGEFPQARYMSYHVYDQVNEDSLSSILDQDIVPNTGSTNPYVIGEDRYAVDRNYTITASCDNGPHHTRSNFLSLPCSATRDRLVDIWFRVYLNEKTSTLPRITTSDNSDCPQVVLKQDSIATVKTIIGDREPAPFIKGRVPLPFKNGDVHFFRPQSTALGANDHVRYLSTRLDGQNFETSPLKRALYDLILKQKGVINNIGNITILKFRIPTFPNTQAGLASFTGEEDVRYWSLCVSGELTDASNCLSDVQFKTVPCSDEGECTTVVVGPRDAAIKAKVEALGFNYLNHSSHKAPILFYRQMLARPDFAGRIENIPLITKKDFADPRGSSSDTFQTPPAMVKNFFADTSIGAYAPVGRQCWYGQNFFTKFCHP